jgi:hypothetical protein
MARQRAPIRWTRRSVLRSAGSLVWVASLAAVTGCRVRLEDDAPRIPLLRTRTPIPDERALAAALTATWRLEDLATSLGGAPTGMPARLRSVHARQAAVLAGVLAAGGAPVPPRPAATASAAPSATASDTPSSVPSVAPSELRYAEQASADSSSGGLAAISGSHLGLFVAVAAQRSASATLLGADLTTSTPSAPRSRQALPLLAAARAARYGFDVVAAQTDRRHRPAADAARSALQLRCAALQRLAGAEAGPPPLGYRLPYRVEDARAAAKLARRLLITLSQDIAAAVDAAAGDNAALTALVRWLAEDEVLAAGWGVAPAAFPGLVPQ